MRVHPALERRGRAEGRKQVEKQRWTDRARLTLTDTVSRLTFVSIETAASKRAGAFLKSA